jgi:hypothetical protein
MAMEIYCPNGFKRPDITERPYLVTILENICNSADLCGIEDCRYNDQSPEAVKKYIRAVFKCSDLGTGMKKKEEKRSKLYNEFYEKGLKVIK